MDCFEKTKVINDVVYNCVYHKSKWFKLMSEKETLDLILKDFNKLHIFGMQHISCFYKDAKILCLKFIV